MGLALYLEPAVSFEIDISISSQLYLITKSFVVVSSDGQL